MKKRKQKVCMFRFNARPRIVMPWTRLSGMRQCSSETSVVLSTGLSGCSGGLNPHRTDSETAYVGSVDCPCSHTVDNANRHARAPAGADFTVGFQIEADMRIFW